MSSIEQSATSRRSISGKVAVITGGGRGIGRATAILMAQAGARVAVVARTKSDVDETAALVNQRGGFAFSFSADVSDWSSASRLGDDINRTLGTPDIVVANASVIEPIGDAWQVDPLDWARDVNINLVGAFYSVRAFLPGMVKRSAGTIIFVSTGAATHPAPGWSAYCAAKVGLNNLALNLAAELDQRGAKIRVYSLAPGVVDTGMQETIRSKHRDAFPLVEKYQSYHEKGWLRPPEEPANAILWLATSDLPDLNGQLVKLDDLTVRARMAADLGIPMFKGRGE